MIDDNPERKTEATIHVNSKDGNKDTFLHYACGGEGDIDGDGIPERSQADIGVIKELLRRKANVNEVNTFGVTPLYVAAVNSSQDAVKLLLEAGATVPSFILDDEYIQDAAVCKLLRNAKVTHMDPPEHWGGSAAPGVALSSWDVQSQLKEQQKQIDDMMINSELNAPGSILGS